MEITTDDYGSEVSYSLTYLGNDANCESYSSGEVIVTRSNLDNNVVYNAVVQERCAGTYLFEIVDSFGASCCPRSRCASDSACSIHLRSEQYSRSSRFHCSVSHLH